MVDHTATRPGNALPDPQRMVIAVGVSGLLAVALLADFHGSVSTAVSALIGGFAGFALYHASFGFTAAWRRVVEERRGAGLRSQMLLFAIACTVAYPLLDYGGSIGLETYGFVVPWGVGSAIGAFLFGAGMQFGGGCASGTLFTSGGGSTRMMVTLVFFILGSVLGTLHLDWWSAFPSFAPLSYVNALGAPLALALTLGFVGSVYLFTVIIEKARWGSLEPDGETKSWITGPWSKRSGAIALAGVSIATLIVLHRPWGITSGFALWGAKAFYAVGIPVDTWPYWSGGRLASLTERSVFADSTSIMNFGIVLGAMIAAGLAGKYRPKTRLTTLELTMAVIGGLLMGYGARLSYGCNIGAYLGGVVSGSISGWWWLIFGFAGSIVGTRLKNSLRI